MLALSRFEKVYKTPRQTTVTILASLTGRTIAAMATVMGRMWTPNWNDVDLLLQKPQQNEPDLSEMTDGNIQNYIGKVVRVRCYSIMSYGAFCDILGTKLQALLHISKISRHFVTDVSNYVKLGQTFDAVIAADSRPGKIALELISLEKE